ncbi:hypothetical protein [Polynucleobacter necessarius]|nr:hypothetical protein [Polynucleobacter necessarius]
MRMASINPAVVFLRKGFLSAVGGATASIAAPMAFAAGEGDPVILEKQE